jgi:predicted nucleic acid-binding Zn ribbon protein
MESEIMAKKERYLGGAHSLDYCLSRFLKNAGLVQDLAERQLLPKWRELVGEQIAAQVELVDVKEGILMLKTSSAAWKSEINFEKEAIFAKANSLLGKPVIRGIRFI